ncbi:MAG: hypothetical protein EZS28_024852 [Streblomastix strix]|uniref:Uncharacterized protein n=1 Tax=Streblomastix strix TaxID=222440 RepID=A0A5J4VAZ7_9EUKA|nr:MAG: hypothetical protein EZS28_024852 [Streblomastix strix]
MCVDGAASQAKLSSIRRHKRYLISTSSHHGSSNLTIVALLRCFLRLHAAILAQIHCLNEDEQVKLKRLVPTRWLSCYDSVTATINELTSIWIALNQISIDRRDSSAKGLLYQTMKIKFIMSLYILKNVLFHIKRLSLVFQQGALVYSQIPSAIESCIKELLRIPDNQLITKEVNEIDIHTKQLLKN